MAGFASNHEQFCKIGPDRAGFEGELLIIDARRAIPEWSVREFNRQAIYFRDKKYYLRRQSPGQPPFAMRYELAPWPADQPEQSIQFSVYDKDLVARRDRAAAGSFWQNVAWALLLPFFPVLGFLWSGVKTRVLQPLGFSPRSLTGISTFLTFAFVLPDLIFLAWLRGGILHLFLAEDLYHPSRTVFWWDLGLLAVLVLDCLVRYHQVLRGDDVPDGFLEWMFKIGRSGRKG